MIRRRARVGHAARGGEIADADPHYRRLARQRHREYRPRRADEIDRAVLHVERHRVEILARQRLGDLRSLMPTQAL